MRAKLAVLITFALLAGCAEDPEDATGVSAEEDEAVYRGSVEELVSEQDALLQSIATDLTILRGGVNLDPAIIDEYVGRYEARGSTSLVFERQGRELWLTTDNGDRLRVVPTTDNEFELLLSKGYHYTFATDGSGSLDATDGPIVRHYQRVE
ncbi:MAG: hypothetical protein V3V67_10950 [Myxococcota bacterium]